MSWFKDTFKRPPHSLGPRRPLAQRFARFSDWRLSLAHAPLRTPAMAPHIRDEALAAIAAAFALAPEMAQRASGAPKDAHFFGLYPSEHYALLAGLCRVAKPMSIIEVGTFTGMSARIFADHAPPGARIETFDLLAWDSFDSHLTKADFDSGRVTQHLADIANDASFAQHKTRFEAADLIFLDAPKDGRFEQIVVPRLMALSYKPRAIMLLDDIRLDAMIDIWANITKPKLDLTGFGHWSGTGLVQLGEG